MPKQRLIGSLLGMLIGAAGAVFAVAGIVMAGSFAVAGPVPTEAHLAHWDRIQLRYLGLLIVSGIVLGASVWRMFTQPAATTGGSAASRSA